MESPSEDDELLMMMDVMLKNPEFLREKELSWVKKIDQTVAGFREQNLTPRQEEVLRDIFEKYKKRSGPAE